MGKTQFSMKMSRAFHKTGLTLKKHSPEIMVITGVIGMVATVVVACKATTKASNIVKKMHEDMDALHEVAETTSVEEYTPEDLKNDTRIVYVKTGAELLKTYAPAIALGTVSVVSILAGHNILRKRTAALAAAYNITDKCFKEYRDRVVERFGKDLDRELRYNIKTKEIEETVVDENGNETFVKKTVEVCEAGYDEISEFAVFFDESCRAWTKDPELNKKFLIDVQRYANERLERNGILFLNELYEMLGIDKTRAGQEVGWIYDTKNPNGDNCVDLGIYNIHRKANRKFVNGYERSVLIDPNVDGYILDLI